MGLYPQRKSVEVGSVMILKTTRSRRAGDSALHFIRNRFVIQIITLALLVSWRTSEF
jgi:hypothetical protein